MSQSHLRLSLSVGVTYPDSLITQSTAVCWPCVSTSESPPRPRGGEAGEFLGVKSHTNALIAKACRHCSFA